jgi:SH3 domain-containing YSC84-like protein 1
MKMKNVALVCVAALLVAPVALRADDERLKNAEAVLKEMMGTPDTGIPLALFKSAKCVVIVPSVKKAALGFGGQYGRGYISCRRDDGNGWSAPGGIRIEGGSVGLQIGGSGTDVIMIVKDGRGVDHLLSNQFKVGADAAVAAGPAGRQTSAETDITLNAEMLAWSRSRGAFAGISLNGSTLRDDAGENKELYGKDIANKDIVKSTMPVPAAAAGLIAALGKF